MEVPSGTFVAFMRVTHLAALPRQSANMFDASGIPVLEQVVRFTQMRHGVLAGNIANIDTPGYRTADLSPERFQARLREAIQHRDRAEAPSSGNPVESSDDALSKVGDSLSSILRHDEGDVSLEHQIAEMTKNQAQHNLAITLLRQQFQLLETAISERIV